MDILDLFTSISSVCASPRKRAVRQTSFTFHGTDGLPPSSLRETRAPKENPHFHFYPSYPAPHSMCPWILTCAIHENGFPISGHHVHAYTTENIPVFYRTAIFGCVRWTLKWDYNLVYGKVA